MLASGRLLRSYATEDAHGLLENFESLSTDAILFNQVSVFNFDKTIETTKNGPKVSINKRTLVVHRGSKENWANLKTRTYTKVVKSEKSN